MTEFEINIKVYRKRLEKVSSSERASPIMGLQFCVADEYLYGKEGYQGVYIFNMLYCLNLSIQDIVEDQQRVCTNDNGPTYIILEPAESQTMKLGYTYLFEAVEDPDRHSDAITAFQIPVEVFAEEVIERTEDFRKTVLSINSDLEDHALIESLDDGLRQSKEAYSTL